MKVAIVAQPFDPVPPAGTGSLGIWVDEVARRLASRHDVAVLSRRDPALPAVEKGGDVRHVRVATGRDERTIGLLRGAERVARRLRALRATDELFYSRYYFGPGYYRHYLAQVAREIGRYGADAIVAINFPQFARALRAHHPGCRLVLSMHCDWLIELPEEAVRRTLEQVDAVTGCSDYVARGVARRFPQHAPRCHALPNGCNLERFARAAAPGTDARLRRALDLGERPVVCFVGRITPEKGVHVLIDAWQQVLREVPRAVLLVIGGFGANPPSPRWLRDPAAHPALAELEALKPCYEDELHRRAAPAGDAIRFLGRVPHGELPALYTLADLFVHPAVWNEPFGMILTEAMASGRAVVASRAGGIPEIVAEGETGLLAEPGDPDSLARHLVALLLDPPRRQRMGLRGAERVRRHFTWERTVARLDDILRAARPGGQRPAA